MPMAGKVKSITGNRSLKWTLRLGKMVALLNIYLRTSFSEILLQAVNIDAMKTVTFMVTAI